MYLLLVRYAADLRNCEPGSEQEEEFDRVSHTLQAYEGKRWDRPEAPLTDKGGASFVRFLRSRATRS